MDQYLGEIRMVGFNFAPVGWALCNGQTLSISANAALFALLGTTYGGNGTTTFCLPDLQGRVPVHQGNGAGLSPYVIGENGGSENATLLYSNLPLHTHLIAPPVSNANGTKNSPVNAYPAVAVTTVTGGSKGETATTESYAASSVAGQTEASYQSGAAGGNVPVSIRQPFLTVNFIIALTGIFPTRD
jgi:microcystin-dependent protein